MNEYKSGAKFTIDGNVETLSHTVQETWDKKPGDIWETLSGVRLTENYMNEHAKPFDSKAADGPIDPDKQPWPNRTGKLESASIMPGAVSYTHDAWDKLVDNMFEEVRHLAKAKGGGYSGDTDRLANFRRNGLDQDLPMESIWRVYAAKRWDAIGQYVKDLRTGKQRERMEPIDGRIKDLIVYLLLFQAMVDERGADQN